MTKVTTFHGEGSVGLWEDQSGIHEKQWFTLIDAISLSLLMSNT